MVAEDLIRILSNDVIILMTVEACFYLSGCVNIIFALVQSKILSSCISIPSLFGVANLGVIGPYFIQDR
jgi:hypothetical protein